MAAGPGGTEPYGVGDGPTVGGGVAVAVGVGPELVEGAGVGVGVAVGVAVGIGVGVGNDEGQVRLTGEPNKRVFWPEVFVLMP